jgi:hypothetical protein
MTFVVQNLHNEPAFVVQYVAAHNTYLRLCFQEGSLSIERGKRVAVAAVAR